MRVNKQLTCAIQHINIKKLKTSSSRVDVKKNFYPLPDI